MSKWMMYRRRGTSADNSIVSQYIGRVNAAGGSVSDATTIALQTFVQNAQNADLWRFLTLVWPCCGSNLAASLVLLKNQVGGTGAWTNQNFVGGDYQETGAGAGLLSNGTTKALTIGCRTDQVIPTGHLSASVLFYSAVAGNRAAVGAIDGGSQYWLGSLNGNVSFDARMGGTTTPSQASAPVAGFWCTSRVSSTDVRLFLNGTQVAIDATSTSPAGGGQYIYGFSYNNGGPANALITARIAFITVGLALTSAQVSTLNLLIAAFNAALTRS